MQYDLHNADLFVKRNLSDLQSGFLQTAGMSGLKIHERLKLARLRRFKTAKEASDALGVPYGTYTGHEAGSRGFAEDVERYAKAFKVRAAWLAFDDGPMDGGSAVPPARSLIDSFDPDEPDEEPTPDDAIAADAARRAARRELRPGEIIERDVRGGMGIGGFADQIVVDGQVADGVRGSWTVPVPFLHTELRAREHEVDIIPVDGDSMLPTLLPGDRVMIHRGATAPSPDGIFAIDDGIGVSVKRLQLVRGSDPLMIRIMSDNAAHREDIVPADSIKVIGRVILKMSRL